MIILTTVVASMMVMSQSAFAERTKVTVDTRNNGGAKSSTSVNCSGPCDITYK